MDLLPLDMLVNFVNLNKKDVWDIYFSYRGEHQQDGDMVYEWRVEINLKSHMGPLIAKMPLLQDSCLSLLEMIQERGYVIPWTTSPRILSNSIESLFLQLEQLTFEKAHYKLFVKYWVELPDEDRLWSGTIMVNSRWDSGFLAQIRAPSLYEVCNYLVESLQQLDPL